MTDQRDTQTVTYGGLDREVFSGDDMLRRSKEVFGVEHMDWLALFTEHGIEWDGVERCDLLVLRPRTLP